jgi:thiol-disulfide isomerase/thioredoxin
MRPVKKVLSNAVTLFLVASAAALLILEGYGGDTLPAGSEAPPFDLETHDGARLTSADLRGQVVLLDFWATWCPPCREEMPWLVELGREYQGKGVRFVAASRDEDGWKQAVGAYARKSVPGLEAFAANGDPFTAGRYRVDALPTLYVIGRDGKIVGGVRGSTSRWRVKRWLNAALEK